MLSASCVSLLVVTLSLVGAPTAPARSAAAMATPQQSTDEAALRSLAEAFYRAWAAKDVDGFIRLWAPKSPDFEARKQSMSRLAADYSQIELKSVVVQKVSAQGVKTTLRVDVETTAIEAKTGKPASGFGLRKMVIECVRENGRWYVWREESALDDLANQIVATTATNDRDTLLTDNRDLWSTDLILAINRVGIRSVSQGSYPDALKAFLVAQWTAERIDDRRGLAGAVGNIGLIHLYQGSYDLALEPLQKSLRLGEELGDQTVISNAWNNLGLLHQGRGNFSLATESYRKCLEIAQKRDDKGSIAIALGNIGNIYNAQGNYRLAAESYQASRTYYQEAGVKSGEGRVLHSLGNIQYYQGNFDLALKFYNESLALKVETGNRVEQSRTMNALGRLYAAQGDFKSAEDFHRKSLAISEAADAKGEIARSFYSLGVMYLVKGDRALASEYLNKSLRAYQAIGDKREEGESLNELAELYLIDGKPAEALAASERAMEIAKRIDSLEMRWIALTQAGKANFQLNQPALAQRCFEDAVATIEAQRTQVAGGEREAQSYFENRISPYHELVGFLVEQKQLNEALAYTEQAKARALLDVLQHGRVGIQKAMNIEEQEQERRLRADLTMLNTQLARASQANKPDPNRISEIRSRLEKARLDYEALQTTLYAGHPELKIQRGEAPTIRAAELATLLPGNGALLEYVVGDNKTYLFAIAKAAGKEEAEVHVYSLPIKREALRKQIESFRQQLAARDLGFRASAAKLYELLLKPAQAQLRGNGNVVIASDDVLWDLPFQALIGGGNRFVIEDLAISYAPSFTVLREMMKRRSTQRTDAGSSSLLAIGNPRRATQTGGPSTASPRGERLEQIPETEEEVNALRRLYGESRSTVYVGVDAREDRVKKEAGNARVLHFAAHGVLNNASPMYSYLAMAPGEANEDGFLEAWELMQLDLKADLAVLSACETARGRIGAGEGMIGLSWAMFIAGVPSIVVSQWKVESAATRDLMVNFHRALIAPASRGAARPTKAEALRQAALKLMKNPATGHPFYWAGFILVGDSL